MIVGSYVLHLYCRNQEAEGGVSTCKAPYVGPGVDGPKAGQFSAPTKIKAHAAAIRYGYIFSKGDVTCPYCKPATRICKDGKKKFYVEVWRDGKDYEAGKGPDQVLKKWAKDSSHAEDLAMNNREWTTAIAHDKETFEEPVMPTFQEAWAEGNTK